MISADKDLEPLLYEKIVPVAFMVLIGYAIGAVFFSVFGAASNAILLCFFYDKDICEKSGRPNNAPEPMREFYETYKKKDSV